MARFTPKERKILKLLDSGEMTSDILLDDVDLVMSCVLKTMKDGILPFLIATRFQYTTWDEILKGKNDIINIKNNSKTVWELFELWLFNKVSRNSELGWAFDSTITNDKILNNIRSKLSEIVRTCRPVWASKSIFNILSADISECDRKTRSDVATPYDLVNEMLHTISTFGDGSCLDMSCGNGTFLWEAKRLAMANGYTEKEVMNQIHGVDINLLKCYTTSALLDPDNKYESNIYCGDSLKIDIEKEFGNMKFDVIVGNPPYQDPIDPGKSIWPEFTNKAIALLKDNGHLFYITPSSWIGKQSNKKAKVNYGLFKTTQIHKLYMFDDKAKDKYFPSVGTKVCWYHIQKQSTSTDTLVTQIYNDKEYVSYIDFSTTELLPIIIIDDTLSIHNKIKAVAPFDFKRVRELHYYSMKKKKTISETLIPTHTYKSYFSHLIIRYSSYMMKDYAPIKVMIPATSTINNTFIDSNCNVSEDLLYVCANDMSEAENILSILNSEVYRYIGKIYRIGRSMNGFEYMSELDLTRTWTDNDIYKFFNFTDNEKQFIKEYIK